MKISLIIIEPSTGLYNVAADDDESGACLSGGKMHILSKNRWSEAGLAIHCKSMLKRVNHPLRSPLTVRKPAIQQIKHYLTLGLSDIFP